MAALPRDLHYQIAARMRYNDPDPSRMGSTTCHNSVPWQRANLVRAVPLPEGRVCGASCGADGGSHALKCKIAGGVQQRHDNARDIMGAWLTENGIASQLEQRVPAWDTATEHAILDVAYNDAVAGRRYVDLAVVAGSTHVDVAPDVRVARHEKFKHKRYPGPALVPFVVDVRGAWGAEALAWLKDIKPQLQVPDKDAAVAVLKYRLAASIQSSVADAVIRSATDTRRPRDPPQRPGPPLIAGAPPGPLLQHL